MRQLSLDIIVAPRYSSRQVVVRFYLLAVNVKSKQELKDECENEACYRLGDLDWN